MPEGRFHEQTGAGHREDEKPRDGAKVERRPPGLIVGYCHCPEDEADAIAEGQYG